MSTNLANTHQSVTAQSGRQFKLPSENEEAAIQAGIAQANVAKSQTPEADAAWFAGASMRKDRKLGGRPALETPKEFTGIRLDADVLAALRASGRGWQTRVNALLRREFVKS
jgi:uncharacterized protein (DUF4415 family)